MFFPNKPGEDWYWPVVLNIVYLSPFHIVSSVFAEVFLTLIVWKKYSASIPSTRMAKESTVVKKNSMSLAESKEAGTEAGQGRGNLLSVDWLTKSSPGLPVSIA